MVSLIKPVVELEALVEARRLSECHCCSDRQNCNLSASGNFSLKQFPLHASKKIIEPIEKTLVAGGRNRLLLALFAGYFLPALALCVGAVMGELIAGNLSFENVELISIIVALAGFLMSGLVIKWVDSTHFYRDLLQATNFRKN